MFLVIDVGNTHVKAALFESNQLIKAFAFDPTSPPPHFLSEIKARLIEKTVIASVNPQNAASIMKLLSQEGIPFIELTAKQFEKRLDVIEKEDVGLDRIANIYGALSHFPIFDCIVVDIGTAITCDYVTSRGIYLGGTIFPGMQVSAKALSQGTHALPDVAISKPASVLGKTTAEHIQAGIYYGLLGAIERTVAELRMTSQNPSDVKVLATGGQTHNLEFQEDLQDFVDLIDPHLTLVGLKEIAKEK